MSGSRPRTWLVATLAAATGVLLTLTVVFFTDRATSAADWNPEPAPVTTKWKTATITVAPPTVDDADAANSMATTIPSGQWLVGTDVEPGAYRSPGGDGRECFWFLTSGDGSQTIDSHGGNGPSRVTLESGQLFENATCQPFEKVG